MRPAFLTCYLLANSTHTQSEESGVGTPLTNQPNLFMIFTGHKSMRGIVLLFLIFPLHCSHSDEVNTDTALANFYAMVGSGTLKQTLALEGESSLAASLEKTEQALSPNEQQPCAAVSLKTSSETIVAVLACDSGQVFICPRGDNCTGKAFEGAKRIAKNKFSASSRVSRIRYQVEFYDDRFIYRIQEKNCLINYRHGCLLYGLGWHDEYTYEFIDRRNHSGTDE